MNRFEVKFTGCPACGGDHWKVIDTMGEFKPESVAGKKDATERLAEVLNETWEKVSLEKSG